jgi:hypothetical protein
MVKLRLCRCHPAKPAVKLDNAYALQRVEQALLQAEGLHRQHDPD